MKKLLTASLLLAATAMHAQVSIQVDTRDRGPMVSPTHYGIFFEDINHAADGGLYAELIRNRSFEDNASTPEAWTALKGTRIEVTAEDPMNAAQQQSLRVIAKAPGAGIRNVGFWGINTVKGTTYRLSFWAKSDKGYKGELTAKLVGEGTLASATVPVKLSSKWKKYTLDITATASNERAAFELTASQPGVFQLDVVSLFPPTFKGRENGLRPDLAQMLHDMHPRFMRFPGGCFVEGQNSPDNAFRWERTIGPIEERPGHWNVNWGYRTTDGIGFHEYLQMAEDLGAKPLYVVNVGIWHGGYTPLDSLQCWIDECMNALEYANGPVNSKYGALRAKNGHPEPFNLEYLEIGNENYNFYMNNNRDQSIQYPERYRMFYDAIKAKYPNMKCIGNVEAWGTDEPSWRNSHPVDLLDEHYYRNPQWFAERFHKYDTYDRKGPQIYVGEYAVTSQFGEIGNLNAALGEAVYMMGMENNSDIVPLNSYAPIFVNENDARWRPDMIRFNSAHCMGTPSYYVQQLFPNNIGTQVVKTQWTAALPEKPVSSEEAKPVRVGVGTWGTSATYANPQLIVEGKEVSLSDFSQWKSTRGRWRVSGAEVSQRGTEENATYICPDEIASKKYTFKARARKNEGGEGFLLVFGYQDARNYNWFNVGGWGNTTNNIEQANGGGRIQLARDERFVVESGRWYDLQVDVDGDDIIAYIDGKEVQRGRLRHSMMRGVYASTTIDDASKTLYVKVVNTGYGPTTGTLNLSGSMAESAEIIRLSSAEGTDENTLQQPKAIAPVTLPVKVVEDGKALQFDVPSYSVNIIKAKLK